MDSQTVALPPLPVPGYSCLTFLHHFRVRRSSGWPRLSWRPQPGGVSWSESSTGTSSAAAPICWRTSLSLQILRPRGLRRLPFGLLLFILQPRQVSAGRPASSQGPSAPAGSSVEQLRGNAVGGYGTCDPVRRKETGTTLHGDAQESIGSWCRPVPECLVAVRTGQYHRRPRRRASGDGTSGDNEAGRGGFFHSLTRVRVRLGGSRRPLQQRRSVQSRVEGLLEFLKGYAVEETKMLES